MLSGLIKSLYHAVSHRVVRGGQSFLYSGNGKEYSDEIRLKISYHVTVYHSRKSVTHEKLFIQCLLWQWYALTGFLLDGLCVSEVVNSN